MKKIFAAVLTLAIAVGVFVPIKSNLAEAQSGTNRKDPNLSSITLSPAVAKPKFDTGQTISKNLTVINDGNQAYTFLVSAAPFSVKDEQYDPDYTTVNKVTKAYQWVQFSKTSFKLKPGESVKVPYTINVPSDAAPGGHYAVLFAEPQPPVGQQNSVTRKKRVGSLLYMTVNGDIKLSGKVDSWSTQLWQKKTPITSDLRIQNTGNTHFQADLSVSYSNIFGKKKFTLNQQALILPGTTRELPINWKNSPALGVYKVAGQAKFLGHTEQLPQKFIIYAPYWFIYTIIGLLVVIVVVTIAKRKVKKSKRNDKASKPKKD